jgi:hypothetical protein
MHTICSSNLTTARRPGVTARPRPAAQARARGSRRKSGSKIFQPTGSRQSGAEFGPSLRSTEARPGIGTGGNRAAAGGAEQAMIAKTKSFHDPVHRQAKTDKRDRPFEETS